MRILFMWIGFCELLAVWITWWDYGLWFPSIYGGQDSKRVHQDGCLQDGGYATPSHGCHKCSILAQWRDSIQEKRSRFILCPFCLLLLLIYCVAAANALSFSAFCFQVFLDVVESVNILVNSNGQIIRSDVVGALKMRTYLRYMNHLLSDHLFVFFLHSCSHFRFMNLWHQGSGNCISFGTIYHLIERIWIMPI